MSKMPIAWHEQCLKNQLYNLEQKIEEMKRRNAEVERDKRYVEFRAMQIDSAKKLGKDGFDEDRFMKPRPSTPSKEKI